MRGQAGTRLPGVAGTCGLVSVAGFGHSAHDLADADEIAVRFDDGEFAHAPGLVFEPVLARDAGSGQVGNCEVFFDRVDITDPQVATGDRFGRNQVGMSEEMDFDGAALRIA